MLNKFWYGKGKQIKNADDAKNSYLGFIFVDVYDNRFYYEPDILVQPHATDADIQKRINTVNKSGYKIYERVKIVREPVFSDKVDHLLNDVIIENMNDLDEFSCEETNMDKLLKELNKYFNISLKEE